MSRRNRKQNYNQTRFEPRHGLGTRSKRASIPAGVLFVILLSISFLLGEILKLLGIQ